MKCINQNGEASELSFEEVQKIKESLENHLGRHLLMKTKTDEAVEIIDNRIESIREILGGIENAN